MFYLVLLFGTNSSVSSCLYLFLWIRWNSYLSQSWRCVLVQEHLFVDCMCLVAWTEGLEPKQACPGMCWELPPWWEGWSLVWAWDLPGVIHRPLPWLGGLEWKWAQAGASPGTHWGLPLWAGAKARCGLGFSWDVLRAATLAGGWGRARAWHGLGSMLGQSWQAG